MPLPLPRGDAPYRVDMLCLGNICRSPIAQVVLTAKLARAGLTPRVIVDSSGTGDWHIGQPMDPRAAAVLSDLGHDPTTHRARQFDSSWFDDHDLVLAMDESNLRRAQALAPDDDSRRRVVLLRAFDPAAHGDLQVPDPWYGGPGGFEEVLAIVDRATDALVEELATLLGPPQWPSPQPPA